MRSMARCTSWPPCESEQLSVKAKFPTAGLTFLFAVDMPGLDACRWTEKKLGRPGGPDAGSLHVRSSGTWDRPCPDPHVQRSSLPPSHLSPGHWICSPSGFRDRVPISLTTLMYLGFDIAALTGSERSALHRAAGWVAASLRFSRCSARARSASNMAHGEQCQKPIVPAKRGSRALPAGRLGGGSQRRLGARYFVYLQISGRDRFGVRLLKVASPLAATIYFLQLAVWFGRERVLSCWHGGSSLELRMRVWRSAGAGRSHQRACACTGRRHVFADSEAHRVNLTLRFRRLR